MLEVFSLFKQAILTLLTGVGILLFGIRIGKKSIENENNKKASDKIKKLNKIRTNVSHLSGDDIDKQLSKFETRD